MFKAIGIIFIVGVCMYSILKVGSDSDDRSGLGDRMRCLNEKVNDSAQKWRS